NGIVASIHAMLQRLLGETINLVTVTAPDLGGVKADPGQMEQMILNLCVNARDAMPDGGRLTVRTANVDLDEAAAARLSDARPGPYVLLEVGDTGVGMDAETRSHLFEPFFTTKEQGKGTGLGLSTVYGTVRQRGGPRLHVHHLSAARGRPGRARGAGRGRHPGLATGRLPRGRAHPGARRDDPPRGGRPARAGGGARDHRDERLCRARGAARGRGPRDQQPARGDHPPAGDRRGDAADERARARPAPGDLAPGAEGAVYVRLHG